jgi:membrane fusion protein, heavy metal efflux system
MSTSSQVLSRPLKSSSKSGKVVGIVVAMACSAAAIVGALMYSTKPPEPLPPPQGITVTANSVSLAPNAPQWSALKLGVASKPHEIYSDPVPARVRIDESMAARVGSPLAGRVNQVFVELGQNVKKGEQLFTVVSADLSTLRSDLAKANVDVEVARAQHQRVHDMVAARLMPGKEELAAEAQKRQAELSMRAAQSRLQALRVTNVAKSDNEFTVIAPRSGVVVDKQVLPSQEVDSNTTLIQIADVAAVLVVADLFETDDASTISVGAPVRIIVPSPAGTVLQAKVESVSAVVDAERHSIPVRVRLLNTDGRLKPNQYVEMRVRLVVPEGATEIPTTALVSDGAKQYVYVQGEPGQLLRRKVTTGPTREGLVVIMNGLTVGETIVEQGGILLDNQIELSH